MDWGSCIWCVSIVIVEQAGQTLPPSDSSRFSGDRFQWSDKPIPEALMVPPSVIMCNELPNRVAQGIFPEEDHLLQTVLLDRVLFKNAIPLTMLVCWSLSL
jgi:hypothetical protein